MTALLPNFIALFNAISAVFLGFGYAAIRRRNIPRHRACMIGALTSTVLFFAIYLAYHYVHGATLYPYHDWTRPIYFAVLIPHVILAAVMTPAILTLVWFALRSSFDRHRRLARWVWPVWMFVSVSGIVVYLMLHQL